ncbi:superoxide dismutase [Saccharomycopsis crataegensis]|uniref:Superoxide dismutase n=1 Tax=Saccharomycopsis crataegensis TaxID=43959 RepID=A0AAV5QJ74_9ASCO|nr:superoxide dismutase [Saccharomycopsis crataegensis]
MSSILTSTLRTAVKPQNRLRNAVGVISSVRTKVTLPDLDWDYGALEPHISGKINELHHKKHHQTYVNGFNDASEKLLVAESNNDAKAAVTLQQNLKFHGGGFVNHNLFWKNLSPVSVHGGAPPTGQLATQIESQFGSLDGLVKLTNSKLAGIQGSGWAFIVFNKENNAIEVVQRYNQDTVTGPLIPLVAIDAWEHAYYLQYQNVKADYFKAIWNVINWKEAESRYASAIGA